MKSYLSLVKFSHTIFALPFAMVGFFMAVKHQGSTGLDIKLLALVLGCMVFARSAAMAFNRWADRHFDAKNPRTAVREIPAGVISERQAFAFVVINCLLFVACTFFINWLCFALSPVALAVILGYSYTKRFTALCHFVLGLGLALAPVGAYIAVTGQFNILPILLGFVVLTWVSGFDIIYALQDDEFDRGQGLHSVPAMMGRANALMLSNVLHVISAALVFALGYLGQFGTLYWIGAAFFSLLLLYQHFLVKPNDLSKVNLAFFTTNGIASVVFGSLVIADFFV
jgi:4-hydroxybenzoate polyprenyltransferase